MSQITEFHNEIREILKSIAQDAENFEFYKKSTIKTILLPPSSSEHTWVNLAASFPPYMTEAKAFTNTKATNKVIFRMFHSPTCGHFAVFACTDSLDRTGLQFGVWKQNQTECLFADPNRCKAHTLIVAGMPLRMCAYCSAVLVKSSYKCSRCKEKAGVHVRYCGIECQHAHWERHKSFCNKTK